MTGEEKASFSANRHALRLSRPMTPDEGKRFLRHFALGFFLVGISCLLSSIFFLRSGENWTYRSLVATQAATGGVFGPATPFDYFEYKLEMIRHARPEIITLGSSRALGFQARYFRPRFVNAAMAMVNPDAARLFLTQLGEAKPKQVIFTLDFWWFNGRTALSETPFGRFPRETFTSSNAILALNSVIEGKLAAWQLPALALAGYRGNRLTAFENYGFAAIASSNGIRPDGSMLYADWALGGRSDPDPQFTVTLERIATGEHNYAWADALHEPSFAKLIEFLRVYRSAGIDVALVLPPVAPTVYDALRKSGRYGYIDELRARLSTIGVPLADFHDPSEIPVTDCEFVDGYHAGDISYLKMLLRMAERWPWLRVNTELAASIAAQFDGNIIDQTSGPFRGRQEVDFMGMGCKRRLGP